jgi:hypothetical protein
MGKDNAMIQTEIDKIKAFLKQILGDDFDLAKEFEEQTEQLKAKPQTTEEQTEVFEDTVD